MKRALKDVTIAEIFCGTLIMMFVMLQGGCKSSPPSPDIYSPPRSEERSLETEIVGLIEGFDIARRQEHFLLKGALEPVPETVRNQAKHARESKLSDEDYLRALHDFKEVLSRRYRALAAEIDSYRAWQTGDRFGPPQPEKQ